MASTGMQMIPTQPPIDYFLELLIPSAVMTFLALLLVVGRVYVRIRILQSFGLDDWLIVGAAVGIIAGMVVTGFGARALQALAAMVLRILAEAKIIDKEGGDLEASFRLVSERHPEIPNFETLMQAQIIAYSVSNTFARLSILLSYRRFTPREVSPLLRKLTVVFSFLTILIGIASIVIVISPCWPPHFLNFFQLYNNRIDQAFFNGKPLPFKCLDEALVIILGNNLGLAPDLIIFAMPFFMLQKANIRKAQRRNLYLLFAFGGVVFAAATARLVLVLFVSLGGTGSFPINVAGFNLSVLEATGMVATACIPTLNPLYRMFTGSRPLTSVDEPRGTTASGERKKVEIMVMMEEARGPVPARPPRSPMFKPDEVQDMEMRGGGRPGINATQSFGLGLGAGVGYGPVYDDKLNLKIINPDRSRSTTPGSTPAVSPGPNSLANMARSLPGSNPRLAGNGSSPSLARSLPNQSPFLNASSKINLPPIPRSNTANSRKNSPYSNPSNAKSSGSVNTGNPGGIMGGGVGFLSPIPSSSYSNSGNSSSSNSTTYNPAPPPVPALVVPSPSIPASVDSPLEAPWPAFGENRLSAVSTSASAIIDAYAERNNTPTPTPPSPTEEEEQQQDPIPPAKPKIIIPNRNFIHQPSQLSQQVPQGPPRAPSSGYTYGGFSAYKSNQSSVSPGGYVAYTPSTPASGVLAREKSTSRREAGRRQSKNMKGYTNGQNFTRESSSSFTLPNGQPNPSGSANRDNRATNGSFFANLKKKADSPTAGNGEVSSYGNGVDAYGREVVIANNTLATTTGQMPINNDNAAGPLSNAKGILGNIGGLVAGYGSNVNAMIGKSGWI